MSKLWFDLSIEISAHIDAIFGDGAFACLPDFQQVWLLKTNGWILQTSQELRQLRRSKERIDLASSAWSRLATAFLAHSTLLCKDGRWSKLPPDERAWIIEVVGKVADDLSYDMLPQGQIERQMRS